MQLSNFLKLFVDLYCSTEFLMVNTYWSFKNFFIYRSTQQCIVNWNYT